MKRQSLTQRILAILKGGDEAKLSRFESKLVKKFEKDQRILSEQITNFEEKILDEQEAMSDSITNVEVDKISSTDGAEDYAVTYIKKVQKHLDTISNYKDEIEILNLKKEKLSDIEAVIFPEEK